MSDGHPYEQLTPDMVIDAVESTEGSANPP